MHPLVELLNSNNFRTYHLYVAKKFKSVNASIMLSELVQRYAYHEERETLTNLDKYDGLWFFYTHDKCEDRTALSRKEQDTAIKKLEDEGLIKKVVVGLPGRRHFQINILRLIDFIMNEGLNIEVVEEENLPPNEQPEAEKPADNQSEPVSQKGQTSLSEKGKLESQKGQTRIAEGAKQFAQKGQVYKKTIEEERLEDISFENDKGNQAQDFEIDRSLDKYNSIVSFDPFLYRLPNGEKLSLRMARGLAKYDEKDREKLYANIIYFEEQIKKGSKIGNQEAYLQKCINENYAGKQEREWQNKIYAAWAKEEYKLHKLEILKTVVRFRRNSKEAPESISYSLSPEAFQTILDKYIESDKNV